MKKKVCFVSIVGRPNVGKSSLLNEILGYNVSIVTNVAQTTRDQIIGIYNDEEYQIVFIDTPGIHKSENELGNLLNKNAYSSLEDVDLILFLTPANEKIGAVDLSILEKIRNQKKKIAIVSKIDTVKKPEVIVEKQKELEKYNFSAIFSTSINKPNSIEDILNEIKKHTYLSEPYYDVDLITDKSMRFIAKEILRKSLIDELYEELPHSVAVEINEFIEEESKIQIEATIYVKKASQKGIVIGAKGSKIKKIGIKARKEMSMQFGIPVSLFTKVKIAEKWVDDKKTLKKFGYE